MKEVTRIVTLQITAITTISKENLLEEELKRATDQGEIRELEEGIKKDLHVDNVKITSIQDFVREVGGSIG